MKQQRKREREQKGSDAVKHAEDRGNPRLRPRASAYKTECARRSLTDCRAWHNGLSSVACACRRSFEPRAVREVSAICVEDPDCDWGKSQVKSHICATGRWCCRSGRSLECERQRECRWQTRARCISHWRAFVADDHSDCPANSQSASGMRWQLGSLQQQPERPDTPSRPWQLQRGSIEPVSKNPWRATGKLFMTVGTS